MLLSIPENEPSEKTYSGVFAQRREKVHQVDFDIGSRPIEVSTDTPQSNLKFNAWVNSTKHTTTRQKNQNHYRSADELIHFSTPQPHVPSAPNPQPLE